MENVMRNGISKLMIIIFLFLPFKLVFAADTYTLDPTHTYVLWHINHFGYSNQTGKWYADGTLTLDKEKPQNSKVEVNINVDNMVTGLPELDKHLKSEEFFDVSKYPQATFVSDKVTVTGKNTAKVHGILTVHGVSKPVTLDVTLSKMAENSFTKKMTVGFSAHTKIKRSDFGMAAFIPALGDEVKIDIEAEATK
jgi:polyisoprenoid-binding protein YceI